MATSRGDASRGGRRVGVRVLVALALLLLLWVLTPRLLQQIAPEWEVRAALPGGASEQLLRDAASCFDVIAPNSSSIDADAGQASGQFHAFGWEVGRVERCLQDLPGVSAVERRRTP